MNCWLSPLTGQSPQFAPNAKKQAIESQVLTIYYDDQCPYILQRVETLKAHCAAKSIPAQFIRVESLAQAKSLPCVFNNWAVFYDGHLVTVNQIDGSALDRICKQNG